MYMGMVELLDETMILENVKEVIHSKTCMA